MSFRTPLTVLRDALGRAIEPGGFDAIRPDRWAATHRRAPAEIVSLIEALRADRATRSAPNAAPDSYGEGK